MRNKRPFLLTLAIIACLSGCDVIENIPRTPEDLLRASRGFGPTTRDLVEETPEGKVYRLTVQSKRAAGWTQADFAMWEELRHSCPDGERYETLSTEPVTDDSYEDIRRQWPADTVFVRTVRCAPKPSFEFNFERRMEHEDAYRLMLRRLDDAAPDSHGQRVVQALLDSPVTPKYEQIERYLGVMVHDRLPGCPSGVVVSHPQIGMLPVTDEAPERGKAAGYLGFIVECAAKLDADAPPAVAPGS